MTKISGNGYINLSVVRTTQISEADLLIAAQQLVANDTVSPEGLPRS